MPASGSRCGAGSTRRPIRRRFLSTLRAILSGECFDCSRGNSRLACGCSKRCSTLPRRSTRRKFSSEWFLSLSGCGFEAPAKNEAVARSAWFAAKLAAAFPGASSGEGVCVVRTGQSLAVAVASESSQSAASVYLSAKCLSLYGGLVSPAGPADIRLGGGEGGPISSHTGVMLTILLRANRPPPLSRHPEALMMRRTAVELVIWHALPPRFSNQPR